MTFDLVDLSSISGVILCTMLIMEVLKRIFQTNTGFGKLPPWAYAIVIAEVLTFAAHYLILDEKGFPILIGRTQTLIWRAFLASAAASGFYTWLNNRGSIADAQPLGKEAKPLQLGTQVTTESTVPKAPGEVATVTTNSTTAVTKTLGILLCIGLGLAVVGCSGQTQIQKAYNAERTYDSAMQSLVTLRSQGVIDHDTAAAIEPIRANLFSAIKKWEDLADNGKVIQFEAFAPQLNSLLDDFIAAVLKVKNKAPTTKPISIRAYFPMSEAA